MRHYFNGLTEEIRKQSANWFYWEDPLSFERVTAVDPEDPPSGWPTLWDEDLLEEVFEVEQTTLAWEALAEGGKRTFATWLKSPTTSGRLELRVEGFFSPGTGGFMESFMSPLMDEITIVYNPASTSTTWSGSTLTIGVDGTAGDFDRQDGDDNPMWTRLERNH